MPSEADALLELRNCVHNWTINSRDDGKVSPAITQVRLAQKPRWNRACKSLLCRSGLGSARLPKMKLFLERTSLVEGDARICLFNPLEPLDLIQHKFVELLGFFNFHDSEYVAGAPTRIGHLDSG